MSFHLLRIVIFVAGRITCLTLFDEMKPERSDYCLHENFNATCTRGQVLVITSAVYGRMRAGRCANGDYSMGCSVDVLLRFNRICGGKISCSVPVRSLLDLHPCQKDYMSYLEAGHVCVRVNSHVEFGDCTGGSKINLNDFKATSDAADAHDDDEAFPSFPRRKTSGVFSILMESRIKPYRSGPRRHQTKWSPPVPEEEEEGRGGTHRYRGPSIPRPFRDPAGASPPLLLLPRSDRLAGDLFVCWWQVLVDRGHQTIEVLLLPFGNDSIVDGRSARGDQRKNHDDDRSSVEDASPMFGLRSSEDHRPSSSNGASHPCRNTRYTVNNINSIMLNNNNNHNNNNDDDDDGYNSNKAGSSAEQVETLEVCPGERAPSAVHLKTTTHELLVGLLRDRTVPAGPSGLGPSPSSSSAALRILVILRAEGCEDVARDPVGFWHERLGNVLNMRCPDTQLSGNLTCIDGNWEGEPLNCSSRGNSTFLSNTDSASKSYNGGSFSNSSVLVAVFFGAGFGVMLGITLLVSLYCARRRYVLHKRERSELLVCGRTGDSSSTCCPTFSRNKRARTSRPQTTSSTSCTPASDREVVMFLGHADVYVEAGSSPQRRPRKTKKDDEGRLCECCPEAGDPATSGGACPGCSEHMPEILFDHRGPKWRMRKAEGKAGAHYAPLDRGEVGPFESPWRDRGGGRCEVENFPLSESSERCRQARCSNCSHASSRHFNSLGKTRSSKKNSSAVGSLHRSSSTTTTFSNFPEQPGDLNECQAPVEWNNNSASGVEGGVGGQPFFQDMCVECLEKYLKQRRQREVPKPFEMRKII